MATTSGAIPGDNTAGTCTLPCADAISTTSPSPTPSFPAVAGLISIQLLHIAEVIGSGNSCSHGRCASDPSRNADDAYGRKFNGNSFGSPSSSAAAYAVALGAAAAEGGTASAVGRLPHQPPFSCASVHASTSFVIDGSAMNVAVIISSNVCHGSISGRASFWPTSISTSGIARVSWSGFIAAGAAPATAVIDPDAGSASA